VCRICNAICNEDGGPGEPPWALPEDVENKCKGDTAEKITWGPTVIFRWDGLTDVDIKYASIRQIIPPDVGGGGGGGGSVSVVVPDVLHQSVASAS
jgi:hypothetical protein